MANTIPQQFKKIQGVDYETHTIQQNIDQGFKQTTTSIKAINSDLTGFPFLKGKLLTVSLAIGLNVIAHGLDHKPTFFIIAGTDNEAFIRENPSYTDGTNIGLVASAAVNARLWVG